MSQRWSIVYTNIAYFDKLFWKTKNKEFDLKKTQAKRKKVYLLMAIPLCVYFLA